MSNPISDLGLTHTECAGALAAVEAVADSAPNGAPEPLKSAAAKLEAALKAPAPDNSGVEKAVEAVPVSWPDTQPGEGKRIERIVLALEFEVWEEADMPRDLLVELLLEAIPTHVTDRTSSDEAAELQQAESLPLTQQPVLLSDEDRERLRRIANELEATPAKRFTDLTDPAFLRHLAQQHYGVEGAG